VLYIPINNLKTEVEKKFITADDKTIALIKKTERYIATFDAIIQGDG
jgi:hypothetical protein